MDKYLIILNKVDDTITHRIYSCSTGSNHGIATYDKTRKQYNYEGDDLGDFHDFVKNTITTDKDLPDKIVHGYG